MESNFKSCLAHLLNHEGGYSDHPKDPGGATNRGVTKKAWEEWVGHEVIKEDIKALTVADVTPFYRKRYWNACRCDDLPGGVDYVVFDISVNSGTLRASKFLQGAAGVDPDGRVGPVTLDAVRSIPVAELIDRICDKREAFYRSLPTFSTFGRGWMRRSQDVRRVALSMANESGDGDAA